MNDFHTLDFTTYTLYEDWKRFEKHNICNVRFKFTFNLSSFVWASLGRLRRVDFNWNVTYNFKFAFYVLGVFQFDCAFDLGEIRRIT